MVYVHNSGSQIFSPRAERCTPDSSVLGPLVSFSMNNIQSALQNFPRKEQSHADGFGQHTVRETAHPHTRTSLRVTPHSPGGPTLGSWPRLAQGGPPVLVLGPWGEDSHCLCTSPSASSGPWSSESCGLLLSLPSSNFLCERDFGTQPKY